MFITQQQFQAGFGTNRKSQTKCGKVSERSRKSKKKQSKTRSGGKEAVYYDSQFSVTILQL